MEFFGEEALGLGGSDPSLDNSLSPPDYPPALQMSNRANELHKGEMSVLNSMLLSTVVIMPSLTGPLVK